MKNVLVAIIAIAAIAWSVWVILLDHGVTRHATESERAPAVDMQDADDDGGRRGGWQVTARNHGWLTDYDQGLAKARETGKPLMLVVRCVP